LNQYFIEFRKDFNVRAHKGFLDKNFGIDLIYISPLTNLVIIQTNLSKEFLLRLKFIDTAELTGTARLLH
jgi:hypothetical protein